MNIKKPLRRIILIRSSVRRVMVIEVKYERLPIFCYACGRFGRMEKDCLDIEDHRGEKQGGLT